MEKDQARLSNEPELYVWYCLKLTHFGHIREGVFTLSLYHDSCPFPFPPDMNRMKAKANEEVTLELAESALRPPPSPTPPKLTLDDRMSATSIGRTGRGKGSTRNARTMKVHPSEKKLDTLHNIREEFFIENEGASDFEPVRANEAVSFDLQIVGLRTLPSHTGPVKLQVRVIDHEGDDLLEGEEVMA
jgi:hypothetical protein